MTDAALQRENMVESQVRTNDVTDRRILRAMAALPREQFVPASLRPIAYMDEEIVLGRDQASGLERAMLRPMVLAKMVQLARLEKEHLVLDVGCLTGYSTALLAELAGSVVGLECDEDLAERAIDNLGRIGADTTAIVTGALADGLASQGPYDVIFISGACEREPTQLCDQLKPGGRLVVVEQRGAAGRAVAYERSGTGWSVMDGFAAPAPVLPGFEAERVFSF